MPTRLTLDLTQATVLDLCGFVDTLRATGTPADHTVEVMQSAGAAEPTVRLEVALAEPSGAGPIAWGHATPPPPPMPRYWESPGMPPPWAAARPVRHSRQPPHGGVEINCSIPGGTWTRHVSADVVQQWRAALNVVVNAADTGGSTRQALADLLAALSPPER